MKSDAFDAERLKEEIYNVDWSEFRGPDMYDPARVPVALLSLLNLTDSSDANNVGNDVIAAIGNNHAGTYYPAALRAADFVVAIEKSPKNEVQRICASSILNDLYYFEPELGRYRNCTAEGLKDSLTSKLKDYSDESLDKS